MKKKKYGYGTLRWFQGAGENRVRKEKKGKCGAVNCSAAQRSEEEKLFADAAPTPSVSRRWVEGTLQKSTSHGSSFPVGGPGSRNAWDASGAT